MSLVLSVHKLFTTHIHTIYTVRMVHVRGGGVLINN